MGRTDMLMVGREYGFPILFEKMNLNRCALVIPILEPVIDLSIVESGSYACGHDTEVVSLRRDRWGMGVSGPVLEPDA